MHFNKIIRIGKKIISENSKTFIIAEAGVNHCGDISLAKKLIDIAVKAEADAVKFQLFKTESLILPHVKKAPYQKTCGSYDSQFDMLKRLELLPSQLRGLKKYSEKSNIIFLVTPFDEGSLTELENLALPVYKISSTDATNLPFLREVARKNKPMILSTGMCYMKEIRMVLEEIQRINKKIILLHCNANYPANDNELNLNIIPQLKHQFNILVGYSDHSQGIGAAPYAVALGARVIEKHFTLDKTLEGPDHKASLNPFELKEVIKEIRKVEKYLGSGVKRPTRSELKNRKALQKCLVTSRFIKLGEMFNQHNIVAKRTGGIGISPINYKHVYGKIARRDYKPGEIISL